MSITKGIAHVALKVPQSKFDDVVKFYMDVFEFTIKRKGGEGADAAVQLNSGNGVALEIFANAPENLAADSVVAHIGLWVEDLDVACDRIKAAGGTVTLPPIEHSMPTTPPVPVRLSFFRGLAGELIEIYYEYGE